MISSEDKLLLDSRSAELKRAFQDIDSNDDKQLSQEELSSYLSKKSGKKFNNELLIEIFRTIDKDHNSQISIEEFIQGYTQAESLLTKPQRLLTPSKPRLKKLNKKQNRKLKIPNSFKYHRPFKFKKTTYFFKSAKKRKYFDS